MCATNTKEDDDEHEDDEGVEVEAEGTNAGRLPSANISLGQEDGTATQQVR